MFPTPRGGPPSAALASAQQGARATKSAGNQSNPQPPEGGIAVWAAGRALLRPRGDPIIIRRAAGSPSAEYADPSPVAVAETIRETRCYLSAGRRVVDRDPVDVDDLGSGPWWPPRGSRRRPRQRAMRRADGRSAREPSESDQGAGDPLWRRRAGGGALGGVDHAHATKVRPPPPGGAPGWAPSSSYNFQEWARRRMSAISIRSSWGCECWTASSIHLVGTG